MTTENTNNEARIGLSSLNAGLEDMTILDYLAARALPAVIAMPDDEWPFDFSDARGDETCHSDHIAMAAYTYAEAMLRARKHKFFASSNAPHEGSSGASREGPLDAVVGPQEDADATP